MRKAIVFILLLTLMPSGCRAPAQEQETIAPASSSSDSDIIERWYREKVDRHEIYLANLSKQIRELEQELEWLKSKHHALAHGDLRSNLALTDGRPGQIVTVYYWDSYATNGIIDILQPVEVLVSAEKEPLVAAVEALVEGFDQVGLHSGFGIKPKLLSAAIRDDVAYIDFDRTLYDSRVQSSHWAFAVGKVIVYTLTELPGIQSVLMTVEGEIALLHGGFWEEPRTRPAEPTYHEIAPLIRYTGPR